MFPWSTIADIAETKIMEVLINFPVGMAIQRLLKRSGEFTDKQRARLDSYFGSTEWFDLLYETKFRFFWRSNPLNWPIPGMCW